MSVLGSHFSKEAPFKFPNPNRLLKNGNITMSTKNKQEKKKKFYEWVMPRRIRNESYKRFLFNYALLSVVS